MVKIDKNKFPDSMHEGLGRELYFVLTKYQKMCKLNANEMLEISIFFLYTQLKAVSKVTNTPFTKLLIYTIEEIVDYYNKGVISETNRDPIEVQKSLEQIRKELREGKLFDQ